MQVHLLPASAEFDQDLCKIIQQVGAEFGAIGDGFGPSDAEVLAMSQHYNSEDRSGYWVALLDGKVVGGGGIAAFNASTSVCELKKLFLLPESRGLGLGKALIGQCLSFASQQGYEQCYLDTLSNMSTAVRLYESFGFEHLTEPMPGTEHNGCDVWMLKSLQETS